MDNDGYIDVVVEIPKGSRNKYEFDEATGRLRLDRVIELETLVDDAYADSLWQVAMLSGALGSSFDVELLSYEAPTYFGMVCAAYSPVPPGDEDEER